MNYRKLLLLVTVPLVLLLLTNTHNAFAWDFGPFSGFQGFQGFHHWGLFSNGQSEAFGCGAYCQGQRDAIYDHDNGYQYNPVGQCIPCHSEFYWHNFHQGYDAQWSQYQSQNTEQNTNVYVNNSPGAYVNTAQNSNQEQGQSQEQGPSWTNPQCLNTDNVNGVCSNGCPWGQEPEGVG